MSTNKFSDIKAVIFDYGGTLDTNARHWAHVLWEGFRHASVPVSEAQFREAYVHAERALAKTPVILPEDNFHVLLLKKVDIETAYLVNSKAWTVEEDVRKDHVERIADYCYRYVLHILESSRKVLDTLQPKYKLVLVSNFYGNIETILKDFRLEYFEQIVESAVVGVRKPDPAIYRLGVEATGYPAGQVAVIGDSYTKDIIPAKTVGCKAVWLKGEGWNEDTYDEKLPDAVITDITQLTDLL